MGSKPRNRSWFPTRHINKKLFEDRIIVFLKDRGRAPCAPGLLKQTIIWPAVTPRNKYFPQDEVQKVQEYIY